MCETGLMGYGTPHLSEDYSSQSSGQREQAAPNSKARWDWSCQYTQIWGCSIHLLVPCRDSPEHDNVSVSSISEHA